MERLRGQIAASPERLDLVLALGNAPFRPASSTRRSRASRRCWKSLEPDSREAGDLYLRMGETYRRKGDAESAIASLTWASQLLPDQPVVVGTLALVLDGSGKKEEAERAYRATLQLDPDNAIAMNNLAFLLAGRGEDLDQALALANRATELVPERCGHDRYRRLGPTEAEQTDAAIGLFAEAVGKRARE